MVTQVLNILLVDDDEIDVAAVQRALARQRIEYRLFHAHDGVEALEMLRETGAAAPLSRPAVVLLDLNMPRMNGFEFLAAIDDDARLGGLPVFVLTTSRDERDLLRAYEHRIAGYIVKSDMALPLDDLAALADDYRRTAGAAGG